MIMFSTQTHQWEHQFFRLCKSNFTVLFLGMNLLKRIKKSLKINSWIQSNIWPIKSEASERMSNINIKSLNPLRGITTAFCVKMNLESTLVIYRVIPIRTLYTCNPTATIRLIRCVMNWRANGTCNIQTSPISQIELRRVKNQLLLINTTVS